MASMRRSRAAVLEPSAGAKPPSSPTPVLSFLPLSSSFSAWKTSTPMRSALLNESAPAGTSMNSWKSMPLSAWAPPLITFIIGTGSSRPPTPPR
jgi:hypothetical protein